MGAATAQVATRDGYPGARPDVTIVVADNDPTMLELVVLDLELEGYNVLASAMSGEAALELCEQLNPDVLVVDQRMPPGLTGLETIERVVSAGTAGACILYTNYRSTQLKKATQRLGATYVEKGRLRNLRAALQGLPPRA